MAKQRGSNANVIKKQNRSLILNIIKDKSRISRAALSKATGLSKGGITPIINDLLNDNLIEEAESTQTGIGRRPIPLKLRPSGGYIIVVDWTRENYRVAVLDLECTITEEIYYGFMNSETLENLWQNLIKDIKYLIDSLKNQRVLGIAVIAPGPIDIEQGIILSPANFKGWSNIPVKHILEEEFCLPVKIDNNANAYALAEKNFGIGRLYSKFIHIVVDEGIGAGILIDNHIYRGKGGFGSEVGHISINMNGPKCECGNRGCLEVYATIPSILEQLNSLADLGVPSDYLTDIKKHRLIIWDDITSGLKNGDQVCVNLLEKEAQFLSSIFVTLINLLEPEAIILGNKLSQAGDFILRPLIKYVNERAVTRKLQNRDILLSKLADASLKGGAMLILQDFLNDGGYIEHTFGTLNRRKQD